MSKQEGLIRMDGLLGDYSFYKSRGQYLVRGKGGVSAERMATDPAFARTREHQQEFGRAVAASKLLRSAMVDALGKKKFDDLAIRLTREFNRVIKTDPVNLKGMRVVSAGEISMFDGFQFNRAVAFDSILKQPVSHVIDRAAGTVQVVIPTFDPSTHLEYPIEADVVRFNLCAVEIDFDQLVQVSNAALSDFLDLTSAVPETTLTANIAVDSTKVVVVVLGVEFFQVVNGANYVLNNMSYNAMVLLAAQKPA